MLNLGIEDGSTDPNKDCSWDKERLSSLRQRILDDDTLISRTDDTFLLSFLRARKFFEDDAFKYIKKYYEARRRYPDLFRNFVPSAIKNFLDAHIAGYMNTTDGSGRVIIVGICRRWDPSIMSTWEALRGFLLLLDAIFVDNLVQTNGVVLVISFEYISWKHIMSFTPNFIFAAHSCMIGCYPISYKQIHIIITQKIASWFSSTLLMFCSKKLRERVYIHSDFDSLHKMIEPKYLPRDYGGELPPFDPTHCNETLLKNEEYFKDCESYWIHDKPK